jgi:flotillin
MIPTIVAVLITLGVVGVAALITLGSLAGRLLYICEPNEVLIFSGRRHRLEDGTIQGYHVVKGGRAWRVPLIERVDRIELTNIIIDLHVQGAYSKGGIPLEVQGVANIKIGGHEPVLGNAIERLLGKSRDDIMLMAKEILEGNLRGVLAQLTPEEVNEDKLAFARKLLDEAEGDLGKLGLVLDTMKIQNVADDRGYLDSIGRRKSADIIKKSRIAEANAKAQAIMRDAENRQRARLRELESKAAIAEAEGARRIGDAETRAKALIAEAQGQVQALIARDTAALEAEQARVEQVRRQLEAEVIEPARAAMEAGIAQAQGRAETILETGRSQAKVLSEMIAVWKTAGPDARDIFLFQKLQHIMDAMVGTIGTTQINRITMLAGSGDGTGARSVRLVEELKGTLGIDLPQLARDFVDKR